MVSFILCPHSKAASVFYVFTAQVASSDSTTAQGSQVMGTSGGIGDTRLPLSNPEVAERA